MSLPYPLPEAPEEPMYVNAKQYHRILKRRESRAKLAQQLESVGINPSQRVFY